MGGEGGVQEFLRRGAIAPDITERTRDRAADRSGGESRAVHRGVHHDAAGREAGRIEWARDAGGGRQRMADLRGDTGRRIYVRGVDGAVAKGSARVVAISSVQFVCGGSQVEGGGV